jgi:hypothetical protein
VFNFAVARVRWDGNTPSGATRVFFRLSPGPAGGFVYSLTDSNRVVPPQLPPPPAGIPAVPLLGLSANQQDIVSIPCFADDRLDYAATAVSNQPNGAAELPSIPAGTAGTPSVRYVGCWLDFNQSRSLFPLHPPAGKPDGPWLTEPLQNFPTLLNGQHQCLTAEVHYNVGVPGAPTDVLSPEDRPGSSDAYSQRNLAISGIGNPGIRGSSRTAVSTFSIRGARPWSSERNVGDELLIHWGNLPSATRASVMFSGFTADQVLALERARGGQGGLSRLDAHTVGCAVGGATYLPIPRFSGEMPALVTLELPAGVRRGERYRALIQQIGGAERAVLGTTEIAIPVASEADLRATERDVLAVLRYVLQRRTEPDAWTPVLLRNVEVVAARVIGFGGLASAVGASLDGYRSGCLGAVLNFLRRLLPGGRR